MLYNWAAINPVAVVFVKLTPVMRDPVKIALVRVDPAKLLFERTKVENVHPVRSLDARFTPEKKPLAV